MVGSGGEGNYGIRPNPIVHFCRSTPCVDGVRELPDDPSSRARARLTGPDGALHGSALQQPRCAGVLREKTIAMGHVLFSWLQRS